MKRERGVGTVGESERVREKGKMVGTVGAANGLACILGVQGSGRVESLLPSLLQGLQSGNNAVKEGFLSLFLYLPSTMGQDFERFLPFVLPRVVGCGGDMRESCREIATNAVKVMVRSFATSMSPSLPTAKMSFAQQSQMLACVSTTILKTGGLGGMVGRGGSGSTSGMASTSGSFSAFHMMIACFLHNLSSNSSERVRVLSVRMIDGCIMEAAGMGTGHGQSIRKRMRAIGKNHEKIDDGKDGDVFLEGEEEVSEGESESDWDGKDDDGGDEGEDVIVGSWTFQSHIDRVMNRCLTDGQRSELFCTLYISRFDTSREVRHEAARTWKSLVHNPPKTIKQLLPSLLRSLAATLSSSTAATSGIVIPPVPTPTLAVSMLAPRSSVISTEYGWMKEMVANCLGDLTLKAGDQTVPTLLPLIATDITVDSSPIAQVRVGA